MFYKNSRKLYVDGYRKESICRDFEKHNCYSSIPSEFGDI